MGFISGNYFSDYDTAAYFYHQLRGGYNCIGAIQPPIRSADGRFMVEVKADGPRVDEDAMKNSRWLFVEVTNKHLFTNPKEVKISDYYTKQLKNMVCFFRQIEDRRLRVVIDTKKYGFSFALGPQRQSERERHPEQPQIVFTQFRVDEVEPRTLSAQQRLVRKTNHWKVLADVIKDINKKLNLETLSIAEMKALLDKIESASDVDEILDLPIFVSTEERITYITDELHSTMKANTGKIYWSKPLDDCFPGYDDLRINHPLLNETFEQERKDAQARRVKVIEFFPRRATPEEKSKTQELYNIINSLKNLIDQLSRMKFRGIVCERVKSDTDLYHLFELAFPNHFQLLYTILRV